VAGATSASPAGLFGVGLHARSFPFVFEMGFTARANRTPNGEVIVNPIHVRMSVIYLGMPA